MVSGTIAWPRECPEREPEGPGFPMRGKVGRPTTPDVVWQGGPIRYRILVSVTVASPPTLTSRRIDISKPISPYPAPRPTLQVAQAGDQIHRDFFVTGTIAWPVKLWADKSEAEVVDPEGRVTHKPMHRISDPGCEAPATTATRAVRPQGRAHWIGLRHTGVGAKPVPDPFPHVTAHVIQTKGIWLPRSHFMRSPSAVPAVPCHLVGGVASGKDEIPLANNSTPSRKFPLRLGGQSVACGTGNHYDGIPCRITTCWYRPPVSRVGAAAYLDYF